jgi:hypothetical protein
MKPFTEANFKPPFADRAFYNGKYQAMIRYDEGGITCLTIRREDRRPVTDWRDVQWIKNQLLGPEIEAVQVFPAESRLVDTSNQFYLYAFPAGYRIPFGFDERMVTEKVEVTSRYRDGRESTSQQRPFAEHVRPPDLAECEARAMEQMKAFLREGVDDR